MRLGGKSNSSYNFTSFTGSVDTRTTSQIKKPLVWKQNYIKTYIFSNVLVIDAAIWLNLSLASILKSTDFIIWRTKFDYVCSEFHYHLHVIWGQVLILLSFVSLPLKQIQLFLSHCFALRVTKDFWEGEDILCCFPFPRENCLCLHSFLYPQGVGAVLWLIWNFIL